MKHDEYENNDGLGTPRVGSRSHWQSQVNQINLRGKWFSHIKRAQSKRSYPPSAENDQHQFPL